MATSKAQIKASNKYNKIHKAKIQANIEKCDFNGACKFCDLSGISKAQLITRAIRKYVIDEMRNGNWSDDQIHDIAEAFEMSDEEITQIKQEAENISSQTTRADTQDK